MISGMYTTSLTVAEYFGKRHGGVLRDIRFLDCSLAFRECHFEKHHEPSEVQNGKPQPYYRITRDGFTFLAMGFIGKEAARWKESYITAFNLMETHLVEATRTIQRLERSGLGKPLDFSDPDNLPALSSDMFVCLMDVFDNKAVVLMLQWALAHEAHKSPVVATFRDIERDLNHLAGKSSLNTASKRLAVDEILRVTEALNATGHKATSFELLLDALADKVAARLAKGGGLTQLFSDEDLTALAAEVQSTLLH